MSEMNISKANLPIMPESKRLPGKEAEPSPQCVKEKIADNLNDGDKFEKLSHTQTDQMILQSKRLASREYQEAENLSLKINDPDLIKQSSTKAVDQQIDIADFLKGIDKKQALAELRTALDLATQANDKELIDKTWKAIFELEHPTPPAAPGCGCHPTPPVGGGCGR